MLFNKEALKDYILRLSLNKKLIAIMLFLSLCLMTILILLSYQTERAIYREFENQISELSKGIQVGVEEVTSTELTDEKRLQTYLKKLNTKGVREISVISNSDRIISSTDPRNIGKWITRSKKELIFKAELGEPVTGEGHAYNIIIPVVARDKHYGYIHLTINTEDLTDFMRLRIFKRILASLFVFAIGMFFTVVLARRYTRPIEDVVAAARKVAAGDLDQELHTERKDEIGELTQSFNYMVRKLREERELEERLRKAEHLASIGQFSRSIAHEIRNPLNFINLSIDHIREKYRPGDDNGRGAFESLILNIKKEIQRVSGFAESFLEYGRPLELKLEKTDIGKIIGDVLELVMAKAEKEGIEVVSRFEPIPELRADPEFMKTCLYNIILNAFQAMPEGGTLTIETKVNGEKSSISISDTGSGVAEENLEKVFDPFFSTRKGGLGLGLALTRRVIEEHKGRVEFKSIVGKGSTVTILLPLEKEVTHGGSARS